MARLCFPGLYASLALRHTCAGRHCCRVHWPSTILRPMARGLLYNVRRRCGRCRMFRWEELANCFTSGNDLSATDFDEASGFNGNGFRTQQEKEINTIICAVFLCCGLKRFRHSSAMMVE